MSIEGEKARLLTSLNIRDGKGNRWVISYSKGGIKDKEQALANLEDDLLNKLRNGLDEKYLYDYRNNSKQPKEWSNIQKRSDMWKLNPKDKLYLVLLE